MWDDRCWRFSTRIGKSDRGKRSIPPTLAAEQRASQNVIFELGYFAGKLGRGRVSLLRKGNVEIPSDLFGIVYTEMDSADGWRTALVEELKAAKLDFDPDGLWR